jgi:hypothetical protein
MYYTRGKDKNDVPSFFLFIQILRLLAQRDHFGWRTTILISEKDE